MYVTVQMDARCEGALNSINAACRVSGSLLSVCVFGESTVVAKVGSAELGHLGVNAEQPGIEAARLVGEVVGLVDGEVAVARVAGHDGHDGESEEREGRGAERLARKLWAGGSVWGPLTR